MPRARRADTISKSSRSDVTPGDGFAFFPDDIKAALDYSFEPFFPVRRIEQTTVSSPTPLPPASPRNGEKELENLIAKLIGPEESVVRYRGKVEVPDPSVAATPGTQLSPPHRSPDGLFYLDILAGPKDGTIALEFAGKAHALANVLVGYILAPGVGGEPVAGFATLTSEAGGEWSAGELVLPVSVVSRLGAMAGPVELGRLNEEGYRTVLAVANSAPAPQATTWRAWATSLLGSVPDLPEQIRSAVARLASDETADSGR